MTLLPPSTNDAYRGAPASAWFLTVVAVATIVPGCLHVFLPDGGAGVIAGLDLSQHRERTIALFAWAGATQIVWGLVLLLASLRNRSFVPVLLALLFVERSLHALNGWVLKGGAAGHHPPEHYASLLSLPVIAVFLALSLRSREDAGLRGPRSDARRSHA